MTAAPGGGPRWRASPRRSRSRLNGWSWRTSWARRVKRFTASAVLPAAGSRGRHRSTGFPSFRGSVSVTAGEAPGPGGRGPPVLGGDAKEKLQPELVEVDRGDRRLEGFPVGEPPRPPVDDDELPAPLLHRGEVGPEADVAAPDIEPDPQGLERPPARVDLERVVAEDGEVRRVRAGADAGPHGVHEPDGPREASSSRTGVAAASRHVEPPRSVGRPPARPRSPGSPASYFPSICPMRATARTFTYPFSKASSPTGASMILWSSARASAHRSAGMR